jgi:two-component system, OmpR family, sensor histidine kinase CssS
MNRQSGRPRRHSIRWRIFLSFAAVILIAFLTVMLAFNWLAGRFIRQLAREQLAQAVSLVTSVSGTDFELDVRSGVRGNQDSPGRAERGDLVSGADRIVNNLIRQISATSDAKIMLVNAQYQLLWPNRVNDQLLDIGEMETVARAMSGQDADPGQGTLTMLQNNNKSYYAVSLSVKVNQQAAGFLVLFINEARYSQLLASLNLVLVLVMLAAMIAALLSMTLLSGRLSRPIRQLSQLAESIGRGDFTPRELQISDRELYELESVMNQAAVRLGQYDKEQKTFFQNVSHELRTPLMSIQGYAEGIKYGVFPDPVNAADVIMLESARLTSLVEDLLCLSRVDNQLVPPQLKPIQLADLLAEMADRLQGLALIEKKQLEWAGLNDRLLVRGNEKLLVRAIENVIANGLRHARTSVLIQASSQDGSARIEIGDDGEGIPGTDLPLVFDRFFKGRQGRFGIGLAITKTIIQQHGGTITAVNQAGGGALFTITLPLLK